jgi:hypothetical protein
MHNNIFLLGKKPLPHQREGDIIDGHCIIFSISFCLVMFHESQHEALWPLKNYKLYIVCTLILFNPFHLTIGSRLILSTK